MKISSYVKKKLNQQIYFNCAVTGPSSCGLHTVDREIFTLKIIHIKIVLINFCDSFDPQNFFKS